MGLSLLPEELPEGVSRLKLKEPCTEDCTEWPNAVFSIQSEGDQANQVSHRNVSLGDSTSRLSPGL